MPVEMLGRAIDGDYRLFVVPLLINPLIDFISLIESRYVLGKMVQSPSAMKSALYVMVDLLLTHLLVCLGVLLFWEVVGLEGARPAVFTNPALYDNFAEYAVFAWSTYFTSALIALFTVGVVLTKTLSLLFSRTEKLFSALIAEGRPTQIIVGTLSGIAAIIYGVFSFL